MTAAVDRVTKLTNEIVLFVREDDWNPAYVKGLREGGTGQITVDTVRDFRTPYGNRMLIATLTVTRARATTSDLKKYVHRALARLGWEGSPNDVLAPGRSKFYSV